MADRALAKICQDVVTEVEALVVELADLRFPVDPDDALGALEHATLALDGALGRLSRAASRAGFADARDDLQLPPGLRVPAVDLADRLDAFVAAVEHIRPVLDEIARQQAQDQGGNARQAALVQNLIDRATVKLDILAAKTAQAGLLDVSGVSGLARQLTSLLQSFVATVIEGAAHLSLAFPRGPELDRPGDCTRYRGHLGARSARGGVDQEAVRQVVQSAPFSVFRDRFTDGGVGPELVVIPAGEFLMDRRSTGRWTTKSSRGRANG